MSGRFSVVAIVRHHHSRKERQSAHHANIVQGGFQATLTKKLRALLPESFDADALRTLEVPRATCGSFWQDQVAIGLRTLRALPADRLLTLRYEDILADPKRQLDAFAAFLGEGDVDEAWSARCAATVRTPRSTWRDLPEDEASALTETCRPGFELLRRAGIEYGV